MNMTAQERLKEIASNLGKKCPLGVKGKPICSVLCHQSYDEQNRSSLVKGDGQRTSLVTVNGVGIISQCLKSFSGLSQFHAQFTQSYRQSACFITVMHLVTKKSGGIAKDEWVIRILS